MRLLVNSGRNFRGDLEGIRGIALLLVLSTHLVEWPTGGHVALDLFFVLSGYLITGLLIREHQRSGTIDVGMFYRRRARRLGPAATLVIVVTVAAGFLIFPLARAISIAWDGVWAFLLVSNWNYAINGTDYFATWQPQSPLLHYWSLSVEEQFYLVWPALILAAVALGGLVVGKRRRGQPRDTYTWVIVVIAAVSVASFAWGVIQPLTNPQVSYLSTLTRAWELGFGALLFFCNPLWERIPAIARPVMSWGGVALLLGAAVYLTPDDPYPSYWALLPAIATMGIIVSGVGGDSKLYVATNPVARYLGQISYSVYLWHWPIFVCVAALVGKEAPLYLWGAVPIAIAIGALAFHFYEDPIRHSSWLEPRTRRRRSERQRRHAAVGFRVGAVAALVAALVLVVVVVQLPRAAPQPAASTPSPHAPTSTVAPEEPGKAVTTIEKQVLRALDTTSWPDTVVAQIESGEVSGDTIFSTRCLDVVPEIEDECTIGDESLPRTAVLLGDSVAVSWMPGLAPALNDLGYRVRVLTHSQCPFADVSVSGAFEPGAVRAGYPDECNEHRGWARQRTLELRPDLVVAADGEAEMQMLLAPDGVDDEQYWQDGLVTAADALGDIPLVVLTSPPAAVSIAECYTRVATVADCTDRISPSWRAQVSATDKARDRVVTPFEILDVRLWYCSPDGWCPPFVDDIVVRSDRQHIAERYAQRLWPVLREAFEVATSSKVESKES